MSSQGTRLWLLITLRIVDVSMLIHNTDICNNICRRKFAILSWIQKIIENTNLIPRQDIWRVLQTCKEKLSTLTACSFIHCSCSFCSQLKNISTLEIGDFVITSLVCNINWVFLITFLKMTTRQMSLKISLHSALG